MINVFNKAIRQSPQTNVLGNIWSSFNMDFTSNRGRARVSPRTIQTTSQATQQYLDLPLAFKFFGGVWYAAVGGSLANQRVFKGTALAAGAFVPEETSGRPTILYPNTDMATFNDALYVGAASIYKLPSSGSWSTLSPSVAAESMAVFAQRLYFSYYTGTTASKVGSLNTSDTIVTTGVNTLDLTDYGGADANTITKLLASTDRVWVLTLNRIGGNASVYEWDGEAENIFEREIKLENAGILAGVIKDDIPYVMDVEGRLLAYNGARFVELGRLPVNPSVFLARIFGIGANARNDQRWIHPNGMTVNNGRIQVLINNNSVDGTIEENLPSGVWEFDDDVGFYHKHSLSTYTDTVLDFGQNRVSAVGALAYAKNLGSAGNGTLLIGAEVYTSATVDNFGIFTDQSLDTVKKGGYFVTTQIDGRKIREVWQKVFLLHDSIGAGKIILKSRTTEEAPTEVTMTWITTTTFTTTTDVSGKEGYEVELLQAVGAGMCRHISSIVEAGGTYTVTIDEAVTGATGTAKARIQNWTKVGEYTGTEQYHEHTLGDASTWLQLKVYLEITGEKNIQEVIIDNEQYE